MFYCFERAVDRSKGTINVWAGPSSRPDPDDLLDQGYTDKNGDFRLAGNTIEMTPIDPILKVYHDCNDEILPGHRKVKFTLPDKYITDGVVPNITMDVGVINLEVEFMKEERELFIS